jgi:amidophosphoribosyltransferase
VLDKVEHNCGIAAVYVKKPADDTKYNAAVLMYKLLLNLQNRGQLSAGVTSYDEDRSNILQRYRKIGSVNEVFRVSSKLKSRAVLSKASGSKLIGHTRYATCGEDDINCAQPFIRQHIRKWKWFSFCFNGQITNYADLKDKLMQDSDYHIMRDTDTEIIMHYLSRELMVESKPDLVKVFGNIAQLFDGAWNIAFVNADGDLVVSRDPMGFRPLCYAEDNDYLVVASESNALINCGFKNIKHVGPGELVIVTNGKVKIKRYATAKKISKCMFEWVYFANVASTLDDRSVYLTRTRLGEELAKMETEKVNDDYVVVPVPDTAKASADSYAYKLGVRSMEGLIRNRYLGRTFIEGGNRDEKVKNKFTPLNKVLKGKKILLVDDSIVRGTTLKKLIRYIREIGEAKEIHVRVACPPIMGPCFYGIDMSTVSELFAPHYHKGINGGELPVNVLNKMARDLNADSLIYQSIKGLTRALEIPQKDLCLACINTEYPTEHGEKLYQIALDGNKGRRTYE